MLIACLTLTVLKIAVSSSVIFDISLFKSYIKNSILLFIMFRPNQHLSNKGIKYAINSLRIALFGYLGMQHSTERSDVALTNDVLIFKTNRPDVFCKNGVLNVFAKLTGKHLC